MKKKLITISICCLFTSLMLACGTSKESSEKKDERMEIVPVMNNPEYLQGTITNEYVNDGCNYLIKINGKNDVVLINPVNLPDQYKKNGAEIEFMYTASKAPQMDKCSKGLWAHLTIKE